MVANIKEWFDWLKSEYAPQLAKLNLICSEGKVLLEEDERFLDRPGNLVDEYLVLEKIQNDVKVANVTKELNGGELTRFSLLILKHEKK